MIIEVVIWQVPNAVFGSQHTYKYRLFYSRSGHRIVGFDNKRGKGDHMHLGKREYPYNFTSVEHLVNDFFAEIERSSKK